MNPLRCLLLFGLTAALAGCFTADESLIAPDKAAFPYEKIVWQETDNQDQVTMVRDGAAYRFRPSGADSDGLLRLMEVEDLYLAELEFVETEETNRLYAVLKIDADGKTVRSYAAVAPSGFAQEGFRDCPNGTCIDKLDAYLAYARRLIADGRPPDQTYKIITTE
jgi:hypothetical protein